MRSSSEIAEEIFRRIQTGHYIPGDTLSQYKLADEFNISRTPVREALRLLEARRAISLSSSGRAFVSVPSPKAIREAFQIRAELEGLAAKLAVDWISDSELELIADHQRNYAAALRSRMRNESGLDWLQQNLKFHETIIKSSQNERLNELIREFHSGIISNTLSFASKMPSRLMEENIQQHEQILNALASRNPDSARDASVDHVLKTMDLVLDWMSRRD